MMSPMSIKASRSSSKPQSSTKAETIETHRYALEESPSLHSRLVESIKKNSVIKNQ